ncbi:hypothetical protein PHYPSEUDO_010120 [Phytophthora pseudosyringae]|uniref:RxLR effector PexRD54 WY domain-containing protein n=1 Tax=Phytophthora pseudosyringae TaxID=221518 RepID=A0A8T1VDT5_9STRA|nr:hypothetical protein PHYPSEUDO_010120 [Phytophthora pseudosyringae]
MRVRDLVLLAAVALLASLDVTSANEAMKMMRPSPGSPALTRSLLNISPGKRLLRIGRTTGDEEERAITLPGAGKLADLLETGASTLVQSAKIRTWLLTQKSTDATFKTLELNMAGNKLFEDPKFITWVVYVAKVEKNNPEEVIFSKLMTQYTPNSLATMIAAAKKVPNTEGLAIMLQTQQRQVWLGAGKSSDDVFKLLELDRTGAKLLESPQFTTWTSYVEAFNRKNPGDEVSIVKKLTKSYDDATLASMVQEAMKVPSTETIAARLQNQQNQLWRSEGKSTDDVFKLLKLNEPSLEVLVDPKLNAWTSYLKAYNLANPGKETTLITTLTTHFGTYDLRSYCKRGRSSRKRRKLPRTCRSRNLRAGSMLEKTRTTFSVYSS